MIPHDIQPRLYEYIGGVIGAHDGRLVAAGGIPNHVHLLVSLSKTQSVADALRVIKTNSSKWMHETYPDKKDFAWQAGYGTFAVSFSNLDSVKAYIAGQEEHHRTKTFQEEFIAFLKRHGIDYDERYMWD